MEYIFVIFLWCLCILMCIAIFYISLRVEEAIMERITGEGLIESLKDGWHWLKKQKEDRFLESHIVGLLRHREETLPKNPQIEQAVQCLINNGVSPENAVPVAEALDCILNRATHNQCEKEMKK